MKKIFCVCLCLATLFLCSCTDEPPTTTELTYEQALLIAEDERIEKGCANINAKLLDGIWYYIYFVGDTYTYYRSREEVSCTVFVDRLENCVYVYMNISVGNRQYERSLQSV